MDAAHSSQDRRFRVLPVAVVLALLALPAQAAVLGPPGIVKSFTPATIATNDTSTLTVTLSNPNGLALTGVAFSDTFPAGLTVAGTPSATNTCGGTLTAVANAGSISLSGGTLPDSGTCSVSVAVTSSTLGVKINTTGNVTSINTGAGDTATATLLVELPLGGACVDADECASGFCSDGVCCDAACDGPLEQCDVAGQAGTCTSTAAGAPALAPWGLVLAALALLTVAGTAFARRT